MSALRHEASDLPARGVAAALAGLFVLLGLSALFVWGLFAWFGAAAGPPAEAAAFAPPGPRLESDPRDARLWREAAVQRRVDGGMSIERAMAEVAARGWPDDVRAMVNPAPAGGTGR